jgi:hypothetical protein
MKMRRWIGGAVGMVVLIFGARPAYGQGWITLPNGQLGYVTSYTTSGMFICGNYFPSGQCVAQGTSVVLTNGGASMTIAFRGAAHTVTAVPSGPTSVPLGTFTRTVSGTGPFTFPNSSVGPRALYLGFAMNLTTLAPLPRQQARFFLGFVNPRTGILHVGANSGGQGTFVPPPPPPATYSGLAWDKLAIEREFPPVDGSSDVTAVVSVVPEPATLALLAPGVLGVLGAAYRRRSRAGGHRA